MVYNLVLCGGVGSRLWPLSRKAYPKQYLKIFENKSLFQLTVERNSVYVEGLITVGNELNNTISKQQLTEIGKQASLEIIETVAKNTAPAIAFAAFGLASDDIIFVSPSDHLIFNNAEYAKAIETAIDLAHKDYLVTFGIAPTKPETGFGYIHYKGNDVLAFIEKPKIEKAEEFFQSGEYLWNSGMFCFKASVYLNELKKYSSDLYEQCQLAYQHSENGKMPFSFCEKINGNSIDYAIMEKTQMAKVVPAKIDWSDLGSFAALWEYYESNKPEFFHNGNLILGAKKHIEVEGLEGVIVVDTEDAMLIIPKDKSQDVKKVYNRIEKQNPILL